MKEDATKSETQAPVEAPVEAPAETPAKTPSGLFRASSPFKALQEEVDRIFQAFSAPQTTWRGGLFAGPAAMGLRVDIGETDDQIQVVADLPGMAEEDVEVTLDNDILRLRAEKKSESTDSGTNWQVMERSHGVFERQVRVPDGIDADKVTARFDKGVLTVTLPKPPAPPPSAKRIAVQQSV